MEPLDQRTLLAVSFKFTIIDPTDKYKSIRSQLQSLVNAAGGEWASHLNGNATLEYNVEFTDAPAPASAANSPDGFAVGAAKTAAVVGTDSQTGVPVYQLGTALEMTDGKDRNGEKADGGILIYGPSTKTMFFEPNTNVRTAPIPEGYFDTYTVLLHAIGHSIGFASTNGGSVKYTYDEHVNFGSFGSDGTTILPDGTVIQGEPDFSYQVFGTSVPLDFSDDSHVFDTSDLMSGSLLPGERKTISRLDLAMLKDAETPIDVSVDPTPEGLYVVEGTGLSDNISLSLSNGVLLIRVNKGVTSFDATASQDITAIIVNGLNGNDTITIDEGMPAVAINGGAGADTIYGGSKGDSILGGGGNDLIFGRGGGDVIRGGDGNDIIYGQGGSDRIFGEAGNDHLDGGVQTDRINGGGNSDTCIGGTEDDFLFGDNGNDLLSGAGGKDRMEGGLGADVFYGGAGNDSVDYSRSSGNVTASIDGSPDDGVENESDNIIDSENIIGSGFDDALVGSEGPNSLIGGAGNDTLEGGGGNDTLEGNNGADILNGGGGNDSLVGGANNDRFVGGAGLDYMNGSDGDDIFVADDGASDTADGGLGIDSITGDTVDEIVDIEDVDFGVTPPPPGNKPDSALAASRKVVFA